MLRVMKGTEEWLRAVRAARVASRPLGRRERGVWAGCSSMGELRVVVFAGAAFGKVWPPGARPANRIAASTCRDASTVPSPADTPMSKMYRHRSPSAITIAPKGPRSLIDVMPTALDELTAAPARPEQASAAHAAAAVQRSAGAPPLYILTTRCPD